MNKPRKLVAASFVLLFGSLVMSGLAVAQSGAAQVLDTVEVFCPDCVLNMKFDDPDRTGDDFEKLFDLNGADFVACTRVPGGRLLCLDRSDKTVKAWPGTSPPPALDDILDCENPAYGFNKRKANTCTGYTFGLDAHFLSGVTKGKTFNLVRDDGDGDIEILYTGRPLLLDIKPVQNAVAEDFTHGPGIIGLEQRNTAVFFKVPTDPEPEPIVIANKKAWGLKGKVALQSIDVIQTNDPNSDHVHSYALVTSSDHRILAKKIDDPSPSFEVFDIAGERLTQMNPAASQCNIVDEQHYGLKVSEKSNVAYLTDRNFCQVVALRAVVDGSGELMSLTPVTEDTPSVNGRDLILSTTGTAGEFFPVGPTTSPGIGFDLDDCETDCILIGSAAQPAAELADVTVVSTESNVTLFQATGLAHCAWIPVTCVDLLGGTIVPVGDRNAAVAWLLDSSNFPNSDVGALLKLNPSEPAPRAEALVFNATPMLPRDITDRFDGFGTAPNELPPLLFPPEYRAQRFDSLGNPNGFFFDALFFVAEQGVETDGVLTLDVDVELLTGDELGCGFGPTLPELLAWDVVVRASERHKTFDLDGNPATPEFQGSMSNQDCFNPTRSRSGGISMFPINFELTPCPVTFVDGEFVSDGDGVCVQDSSDTVTPDSVDDAVFAKLYVKLYDELLAHLNQLACTTTDFGGSLAPLSSGDCASLNNFWVTGKDKLVKALQATILPMNSSGSRNFGAVASQLENYGNVLAAAQLATPNGPDPANRVGEQAARVETLEHLLNDKFLPSIPPAPDGFDEDDTAWAEETAP